MKPAMIELNDLLLEAGIDQDEIDYLLSRFLEEEAENYVDFINGELSIDEIYNIYKS